MDDESSAEELVVPRLAAASPAGEEFVLRRWEMTDLPLVQEASTDPYIPLTTSVPPMYSRAEGEAFVRRQWTRAETGTGYPFVVERRSDARPLGGIGLWLRDLPDGRATIGYWISPRCRGAGAAGTALNAVAAWALGELRIPRLQLFIEPWNTASCRTAERAGFTREGLLRSWQEIGGQRRDMVLYGRVEPAPLVASV
ncbi:MULTISPECIES: GNAT family N-acetyltransferase [Streptomyces]|uniref:GNAT family N-acetyltransferase n=1 Tax=Streptomyces solicathayae TaxID=3081768 RepID=A0ABZ0LWP1_9ACTN|nr:GNAT family N-acetyltransferase [Streptomyces sp. HUAS YS2]WOX23616.1 GNAT family N-acetyltransferase [Streptomyces sp. HUAS YS2]